MLKISKDEFNVASRLRFQLQKAVLIADDLKLEEINTGAVLLAMFDDEFSILQEIYKRNGISVYSNFMFSQLFRKKELYEEIFEKDFPAKNANTEISYSETQTGNASEMLNEDSTDSSPDMNELIFSEENLEELTEQIKITIFPQMEDYNYDIIYSQNLKKAIADAGKRCQDSGKDYIDEENFLYSIFNLEDCSAKRVLNTIHEDLKKSDIEMDIIDLIDELVDNYTISFSKLGNEIVIPKPLENCCSVLNEKYTKGIKCDILGRDDELNELWSILSKKQKSNAVLAGEAGVGKSAIVEALTMSIVNETCPKKFIGYKVVELDVSGMIAGTKYRGEFEKKVEYLVEFINSYDNLIIFIDEMHHIMGAGSSEGSGPDLSGLLKPILARDKVKFIGATTFDEYKQYICRDNAFRRRLELVVVKEPKQSEVLDMLKVKIENLKKFHDVKISRSVLEYIQLCASCFNTSTSNPDKTLDLIDRAMVSAVLAKSSSVKREHVDKVFYKNYKDYMRNSSESNKRTAYHEAGHFVMNYLYKHILVDEEVYALSVIPGFGFLGANILESTGIQPKGDQEYFKAEISSLLAGRIAEEIFFDEKTSGASNDLGKVSRIARKMVTNYGLSTAKYDNFSVYDESTGNTLPLSDKVIDDINKEAKEIVNEVYSKTKQILNLELNKKKIEVVANILLKKKIVSALELEEAISKL